MVAIRGEDYVASGKRSIWMRVAPTGGKQIAIRIVKLDGIGAKGIDSATAQPFELQVWLGWVAKFKDDFVACSLRFRLPSCSAHLCHRQTSYPQLRLLIFEIVWMLEVHKTEDFLARAVHGYTSENVG
jgi:hypothetical protein